MKLKFKFWMVLGEAGGPPRYRHDTEESARTEAERLARTHGGTFHVLECKASCTHNDVDWLENSQPEPRFGQSSFVSFLDEIMKKGSDGIPKGPSFPMDVKSGFIP